MLIKPNTPTVATPTPLPVQQPQPQVQQLQQFQQMPQPPLQHIQPQPKLQQPQLPPKVQQVPQPQVHVHQGQLQRVPSMEQVNQFPDQPLFSLFGAAGPDPMASSPTHVNLGSKMGGLSQSGSPNVSLSHNGGQALSYGMTSHGSHGGNSSTLSYDMHAPPVMPVAGSKQQNVSLVMQGSGSGHQQLAPAQLQHQFVLAGQQQPPFVPGNSQNSSAASSGYPSLGSMSLQNQMLAQFQPQNLQHGMPLVPPRAAPSSTSSLSPIHPCPQQQVGLQGAVNASGAVGRRIILQDSVGSDRPGTGLSTFKVPTTAVAVGDTEGDLDLSSSAGGPASGAKLRDPNDKGPKQCIVKFLADQCSELELRALFQQFGPVEYSRMIYDTTSGSSKGYGFVYYYRSADAAEAVKGLDSFELYGRYLRVGFAIPQRQPPQPLTK